MISNWRVIFGSVILIMATAAMATAKPSLLVTFEGQSGGNNQWQVAVAPDPAFFAETTSGFGSSLATELAFAVDGSSIVPGSVAINTTDWDFPNPGNNPFLGTVTFGLWLSAPFDGDLNQAFASFGSRVFLDGAPVPLFNFATVGIDPTTIRYGVAASGDPTKGSIIAQTGQNFPAELAAFGGGATLAALDFGGAASGGDDGVRVFSGYSGSVSSVPEPSTAMFVLAWALSCFGWRKRVSE